MTNKLEIGQTVYVELAGNYNHHSRKNNEPVEATVETVGRKYFTIRGASMNFSRVKFDIDSLHSVEDHNYYAKVYLSHQELKDKKERGYLTGTIRKYFDGFNQTNLSLDQLRRIDAIIKESEL